MKQMKQTNNSKVFHVDQAEHSNMAANQDLLLLKHGIEIFHSQSAKNLFQLQKNVATHCV